MTHGSMIWRELSCLNKLSLQLAGRKGSAYPGVGGCSQSLLPLHYITALDFWYILS